MKSYPSIPYLPRDHEPILLYTFGKIDGSCLRFEWSRKQGWYKAGTRNHLIGIFDPVFSPAIELFKSTVGKTIVPVFEAHNLPDPIVVFCEYWGPSSFAGLHEVKETKQLALIDVSCYKQGIMKPSKFVAYFYSFSTGPYLGKLWWNEEFRQQVRSSDLEDMPFEGVVGKDDNGNMYKLKSQAWFNKLREFKPVENIKDLQKELANE
jgi:hypothetical protein